MSLATVKVNKNLNSYGVDPYLDSFGIIHFFLHLWRGVGRYIKARRSESGSMDDTPLQTTKFTLIHTRKKIRTYLVAFIMIILVRYPLVNANTTIIMMYS